MITCCCSTPARLLMANIPLHFLSTIRDRCHKNVPKLAGRLDKLFWDKSKFSKAAHVLPKFEGKLEILLPAKFRLYIWVAPLKNVLGITEILFSSNSKLLRLTQPVTIQLTTNKLQAELPLVTGKLEIKLLLR